MGVPTDIDDTVFTCTVFSGSEPTHGSVGFGSNCDDVTYTATDLSYNGSDSFTFRVTDDGGGQGSGFKLSDDQAVSVTITPVQDLLSLGHGSRMNTPSTLGPPNWCWRLQMAR